ncbi:hypothetical protein WL77_12265 [Burkholderia ubonensis]|uniref:gp53-like domain-containing protein n=1 Tax=Burkholderia ubonensis TaxID=101571 RepID=UPI0007569F02|nr:hypothetical protein [Burkholderia ubonensis]KWE70569.1 hypothetical protein WL77_12265 [Burkholderia ubonensis]KWE74914.1 hypothetical protein WL79_13955 [Burkholderia ubonensis]
MATNDFLPFGGGGAANVIDQATYAALAARQTGFQSGTAQSPQLNKVWRQSSIMAAVLAQFIVDQTGQSAVDDGTTATLEANLKAAINAAGITAPQFDNSTKLATTAFVQQALGNFQGFVPLTASATLTASQTGSFIEARGTSGYSIALPPPLTPGLVFTIFNANSNSVTLSTSIGAIYSANNSSSSYILTVAQSAQLVSDGSNWVVISGQAVGALLTNGYQKLPSGLIIQWTQVAPTSANAQTAYNFPIAYPTGCLGMSVSSINNGNSYVGCQGVATSRSAYTVMTQVANTTVQVIAVGY